MCSKELCPGAFEARAAGRSEADSDSAAGGGHAGRARPKKGAAATATAAGRTGFGTLQQARGFSETDASECSERLFASVCAGAQGQSLKTKLRRQLPHPPWQQGEANSTRHQ